MRPGNVVLYSAEDMEPITVIHLSPYVAEYLDKHRRVTVPIWDDITRVRPGSVVQNSMVRTIELYACEAYVWGQEKQFEVLVTRNDVLALLLKSTRLPGQEKAHQEERKKAFWEGVECALDLLARG